MRYRYRDGNGVRNLIFDAKTLFYMPLSGQMKRQEVIVPRENSDGEPVQGKCPDPVRGVYIDQLYSPTKADK